MEESHNTVENTISAEKKKRSRKKTDQPKDIKPDIPESVDMKEFEKRKLTHHMEKTIRLDHAYYGNNRQELEDILKELNQIRLLTYICKCYLVRSGVLKRIIITECSSCSFRIIISLL